jgi:hypothetical protein
MQKLRTNLLVVLGCLLAAILIRAKLPESSGANEVPADERLALLPYHLGPYTGREAHGEDGNGYPGEVHRIYSLGPGHPIELLAYSTSVGAHGPENCLPYLGWSLVSREQRNLEANPAIKLQTVLAVSDKPSEHPLVCGYYWRRSNRASVNFLAVWLQQRWAIITQSMQDAELVSICTNVDDVRQAGPAMERVHEFANDLEPYFRRSSAPGPLAANR